MRIKKIMALGMVMAVFATGCQQAPEDAVVKEKNLDKMIAQAQESGTDAANLEEMADKQGTYENTFSNEKLGVKVQVDAKVDIPKAKEMSIFRVKKKEISQQFLGQVIQEFGLHGALYDSSVKNVATKAEIEKEIQYLKNKMASLPRDAEDYEEMKKDYEEELKDAQKRYEEAPKIVDYSPYLSDEKMKTDGRYGLAKNARTYYGVTGSDAETNAELYAGNDAELGNYLRYFSSKNEIGDVGGNIALGGKAGPGLDTNFGMWRADKKPTGNDVGVEKVVDGGMAYTKLGEEDFYAYDNEPTTISEVQARETAENFLERMGLTDYKYSEGGLYCEAWNQDDDGKVPYRKVWCLNYLRDVDGVPVNNESGAKEVGEYQGSDYTKRYWSGESIKFCINDTGIVTFLYNEPIELTETVVQDAKLKNFDKIKKGFEKMVVTANAQNQEEVKEEVTIHVDKVILRYMRISEKDSFDTGLLVPVWDFLGTKKYKYNDRMSDSKGEESILTINAIDGTVIDKELGY